MTTRNTSREAYQILIDSGQLKGNQARVLAKLIDHGPATSGEILDAMGIKNANAWRARFTELQGRGLIREVAQRPCKISKRTCVVWAHTDRTKPLDVSKGAKVSGSAKAWKAIADRAVAVLHAAGISSPIVDKIAADHRALS